VVERILGEEESGVGGMRDECGGNIALYQPTMRILNEESSGSCEVLDITLGHGFVSFEMLLRIQGGGRSQDTTGTRSHE